MEKPTTRIVESTYIGEDGEEELVEETRIEFKSGGKKNSTVTYTTSGGNNVSSFKVDTKMKKKKTPKRKVKLTKQQVN